MPGVAAGLGAVWAKVVKLTADKKAAKRVVLSWIMVQISFELNNGVAYAAHPPSTMLFAKTLTTRT
jgi:hypothetical protein